MRTPLIAGNWKMNTTFVQATRLTTEIVAGIDSVNNVEKVLCPPAVWLTSVSSILKYSTVRLGAQNAYYEPFGAFTGEISIGMLGDLCQFVIVGHSERRHLFGETDEIVSRKLAAVMKLGLCPILCVGEKLDENESGQTEAVLRRQVRLALSSVRPDKSLVVAYEPVWAIGTGRAATVSQAVQSINVIRLSIGDAWGRRLSDEIRILYGGSVTPSNVRELMSTPSIDGALVGGASLKAEDFNSIVTQTASVKTP